MKKEGKIAVIGDKDSVLAFKALGLAVFSPEGPFEVRETIKRLARENYAVIYIGEAQAEAAKDVIARYNSRPYPAIIPLPDSRGTNGYGMAGLKKNVERAIGADIIFKEKN